MTHLARESATLGGTAKLRRRAETKIFLRQKEGKRDIHAVIGRDRKEERERGSCEKWGDEGMNTFLKASKDLGGKDEKGGRVCLKGNGTTKWKTEDRQKRNARRGGQHLLIAVTPLGEKHAGTGM